MDVHSPWIEPPYILEKAKIRTKLFPGDGVEHPFRKMFLNPLDEDGHIGNVSGDCPGSEIAERKNILMLFKKDGIGLVHGGRPPDKNKMYAVVK